MRYWTWGEIREKIESELDLQEEPDILAKGELCGYLNDAIDLCEQHFIKLGDYFFSVSEPISIVPGTKDYDLPEDIYATKIRKIFLDDEYEIKQLKELNHIPALKQMVGNDYRYRLINMPGAKPKLRLYPTPTQAGTLEIYYTRNANRIDADGADGQEVDIPEAMNYILEYLRMCVYRKEKQFQSMMDCKENLVKLEDMLLGALGARVDDENNQIDPDVELYEDHT